MVRPLEALEAGERVLHRLRVVTEAVRAHAGAALRVAGAGLIAALATRARPRHGGLYALLVGTLLLGAAYIPWVANAPDVTPPGSWSNYLFSIGAVAVGLGGATFRIDSRATKQADRLAAFIRDALPLFAVAIAVACLVAIALTDTTDMLVRPLGWAVILTAVLRQALLVRERSAAVREALESARHLSATEERHRRLIERIGLEPEDRVEILALVSDRNLFWAASRRAGAFSRHFRQIVSRSRSTSANAVSRCGW